MTEFCRICLVYNEELITLIKSNLNQMELSKSGDMFEQCLNIMLFSLPQYKICMDCNIQLKYFYDFKVKALKSHEQLSQIYQVNEENNATSTDDIKLIENESITITENINNEQEIDSVISEEIIDDQIILDDVINDITNNDNEIEIYEIEYLETETELEPKDINKINYDNREIEENKLEMKIENTFSEIMYQKLCKENVVNLDKNQSENCISNKLLENKSSNNSDKNTKKNFKCTHCQQRFRSEKTYSAHINIHNGLLPWICKMCGKGFQHRKNYDYHMKNHANKRSFICTICSKGYICKWDLKVHESVHTKKRPFSCEFCNKSFRIQSHWKEHLQTHNPTNTFECFVCQQKYKSRASLKIHINSIHNDTKFVCTLCDKNFNRKHHLLVHLKTHAKKESLKNL